MLLKFRIHKKGQNALTGSAVQYNAMQSTSLSGRLTSAMLSYNFSRVCLLCHVNTPDCMCTDHSGTIREVGGHSILGVATRGQAWSDGGCRDCWQDLGAVMQLEAGQPCA